MTELTDDELLIIWRINFAKTNKLFLDIARAAIAADRDLTAALAKPADAPAAGTEGPSDEEIMELMPQQMREDLAAAARAIAEQAGTDSRRAMGAMRIILNRHAVDLALAVLTRWGQPPAPPAEGEVAELVAALRIEAWAYGQLNTYREWAAKLARTAELLERHAAPVPVPVAERLPGPEDCDAEGYCWRWNTIAGSWARQPISRSWYEFETHSLPAHALPLPAPQGGEVG